MFFEIITMKTTHTKGYAALSAMKIGHVGSLNIKFIVKPVPAGIVAQRALDIYLKLKKSGDAKGTLKK